MDLTHRLHVPVPLDQAWAAVRDPHRWGLVAPGTTIDSVDGDDVTGTFKIKLGPLALAFAGTAQIVGADAEAHTLDVSSQGTDRRGHGAVEATHHLTLAAADEASTEIEVQTDLVITGRPAQLGRGVVSDAVDRVVEQAGSRVCARVSEGLPGFDGAESPAAGGPSPEDVVDHPVELGATFGDLDEASTASAGAGDGSPAPSPSPQASPPTPTGPVPYVYRPYGNAADPHVNTARTLTRLLLTRVAPYAGLGGLVAYGVVTLVRHGRARH